MLREKLKPFTVKLNGKQKFRRLLGGSRDSKIKGLRSGQVILDFGDSIGIHSTEKRQEIIIILRGKGTVYYGKRNSFTVGENSFVYLPPETRHNIRNTGRGLLKYIYITSS